MEYLPLFVNIRNRPCLVVGGGTVALRKAALLLKTGARLTVVAERLCPDFQVFARNDACSYLPVMVADVSELALGDYYLVIAATSDSVLNQSIAERCRELDIRCNVASESSQGDTLLPAVIDRDPVIIALHSGAQSPTLTRYLKRQLDAFVPRKINLLVDWAEQWRGVVKERLPSTLLRQRLWDRLLAGVAAERLYSGDRAAADKLAEKHLSEAESNSLWGEVFLVGAGPGDPELLTLKALRLIQQADIVLFDRLVSEPIMSLLPDTCERLYVGKRQAEHAVPQDQINQKLVDLAKSGRNVLRLKGGDPFIFGRGGEEIELLAEQGVSFQVVPGITAASGCASYAGIPLTHRDHSQSVRFVTGHLQNNTVNLPWPELAQSQQTLVFYMGLSGLSAICDGLIANGRSPDTPAAIVEKGTTPDQRVIIGTLETLPALVSAGRVQAPTLLIIGEVVALQSNLSWFNPS